MVSLETKFLIGMMELQYGKNVVPQLKKLSGNISWAQGWPEEKRAFWNGEAFMWNHKIERATREVIHNELMVLREGKNLDLGCGAYSYVPSVGFDISPKMLQFNEQCTERVVGDIEEGLPFSDSSFDSVTAVFLLNYVKNYSLLMNEVYRVLKQKGVFVGVISAQGVNEWQKQKEVTTLLIEEWKNVLQEVGFSTRSEEKEKLWFLWGKKR